MSGRRRFGWPQIKSQTVSASIRNSLPEYVGRLPVLQVFNPDCVCLGSGDHDRRRCSCIRWIPGPEGPNDSELAAMLRRGAAACPGDEACVELLIAHGFWLSQGAFRRHIDVLFDVDPKTGVLTFYAEIRWPAVLEELGARRSGFFPHGGVGVEQCVLSLAGMLAHEGTPSHLGWLLGMFDSDTRALVLKAIAHAADIPQEWAS
jgi:hypothetical protein